VFDWGIQGAAWATVISYFIGTLNVTTHFLLKTTALKFHLRNFKLEKDIVKSILSIGMSPFSMQLGLSLVVIFVNSTLLKYGGDLAVGAYGIINSINMLVIMFIIGLNQGSQPIIGYNFGAKKYDRVFKTLRLAVFVGTGLSSLGFAIGMFIPDQAVSLFTTDLELKKIAANALRISVIMFPIIGFQIVISNFFQSIGKARLSIFLSLTRQFIFLIPALFILPSIFGLNGAWAVMPVSDALSSVVSAITFFVFYTKFKNSEMQLSAFAQ
jgi:Na+-driven multidrug efflux pump